MLNSLIPSLRSERALVGWPVAGVALGVSFLPAPFGAMAAPLLLIGALVHPVAGLASLLVLLPFATVPIEIGSFQIQLAELSMLSVILGSGLKLALQRTQLVKYKPNMLDWAAALLLVGSILSFLAVESSDTALRAWRWTVVEPLGIYAIARVSIRSPGHVRVLFWSLVIGGVVVSVFGLIHYLLNINIITADDVRRIRVFYGSPNNLALILGRAIPIALALALVARRSAATWIGVVLMIISMALTFSVGGWVATVIAVFAVLWLSARQKIAIALLAGALVLVAVSLMAGPGQRISSHFSLAEGTTGLRISLWQSSVAMALDHPIIGVGPDNFIHHYDETYRLPEAWREPNLSHPHNLVLDFWLSAGLLGLASLAMLIAGWVRYLAPRLNFASGDGRTYAAGIAATGLYTVSHGLIDNSYFLIDLALWTWLMSAILGRPANEDAI